LGAPVARAAERGAGGARPLRRAGRPVARARLGAGRVGARAAGRAAQEVEVGGDQGQGPHVMTDMDPPTTLEGSAPTLIVETVVLRCLAGVTHAEGGVAHGEVTPRLEVAAGVERGEEEARRILEDELNRRSDVAALARQIPDPDERMTVFSLGCAMVY